MVCNIKTILAVLDRSQMDLAEALGINRNTVTNLSRNKSVPLLNLAYDIRDTLNSWAETQGVESRWTVEQIWERKS